MTKRPGAIVLAAGGTGGHMFPAEALAAELNRRGCTLALVTDRRGASFGEASGVKTLRITAGQVTGSVIARIRGLAALARGTLEASRLLRELSPDVVVGFGGYASLPTMIAATRARISTVLHEQNAVLGRANRLLAGRVDIIATSFADVARLPGSGGTRVVRTGNPVRPAIAALSRVPYPAPQPGAPLHLLVTGGSQGAAIFGQVVPPAVALLPAEIRTRLHVAQQIRAEDAASAAEIYAGAGVRCDLRPFLTDMPEQLARAHLVICRAGASTIAEIAAAGRPGILVPYPFATDDHQSANAAALAGVGGGTVVRQPDLDPRSLAAGLEAYLSNPAKLIAAAGHAREFGVPDAAERLAAAVVSLIPNGGTESVRERAA